MVPILTWVFNEIIPQTCHSVVLFVTLLAFIALSTAQSSAQTRINSAILVIDTSNNASYNQVHWLVRTPYLSINASNDISLILWNFLGKVLT